MITNKLRKLQVLHRVQAVAWYLEDQYLLSRYKVGKLAQLPISQDPVVQKLDSAMHQAQVVGKVDNDIHRINHYPVDSEL